MFNKYPNLTGEYLGKKMCLDEEQFRLHLET